MKLRSLLLIGAVVAVGLTLRRKPGARESRLGAVEDPEAAQFYRRMSSLPHFRLINWAVARRATKGGIQGKALDVGCGPGNLVIEMARQAPGLTVTGIDPSREMVGIATGNAPRSGLASRVSFTEGASEAIPFPNASFDLVVSTLSLHHWPAPVEGLREMVRVLKPGGRLLIMDFRRDLAVLPWFFLSFVQHFVLPAPARQMGEPLGSIKSAYTPLEAAHLAEQAGLSGWAITTGPAWLTIESQR